jgi:6-phosphogluconolactonase
MVESVRWSRFADADAVAAEAVRRILLCAQQAVEERGCFRMVLAGGGTPRKAYRLLAESAPDQSRWHLYYGDERCLPRGDSQRNSSMVEQAWLQAGRIPQDQIHTIAAETGPVNAARCYEKQVRDAVPFDLVLLGMGEDGHTASLFPGHAHDPARLVVPVHGAPKPPPERVSLNYPALTRTSVLLVLVTGAGKRDAIRQWRGKEDLPVSRLECPAGIDVLLDQDAWDE